MTFNDMAGLNPRHIHVEVAEFGARPLESLVHASAARGARGVVVYHAGPEASGAKGYFPLAVLAPFDEYQRLATATDGPAPGPPPA